MENKTDDQNKNFPEGHFIGMWMGIGVAIFAGLGVPLSRITGHSGLFGVGPALGVVLGLLIGKIVEDKKRQAGLIRPLNATEKSAASISSPPEQWYSYSEFWYFF